MIWPFKKIPSSSVNAGRNERWPRFVHGNRAILCWIDPDRTKRLFLVARRDGTFSVDSWFFSEDKYEMCWIPNTQGKSLYDSEETAVREIHATNPWTRDVEPIAMNVAGDDGRGISSDGQECNEK